MNIKITLRRRKGKRRCKIKGKAKLSLHLNKDHSLKKYGGTKVFSLGSRAQNLLFHFLYNWLITVCLVLTKSCSTQKVSSKFLLT
jgi:hypothetical protein